MRGYIRKRGKESWEISVRAGRDPVTRKLVRVYRNIRGTRKDAEKELARLVHEVTTGALVNPERVTVGEWLERWLHDVAKPNVAPKTWERYEEIVRLHLKPHLGRIPLHRLRPALVQQVYAALQESGRHPRTILHVHRVLHCALQHAVRLEAVGRNICDSVSPPRVRPQEAPVVTEEELALILRAAEGTRMHVPVLLAATCGLRRGEVLALKWSDVDLETGVVHVRRSLEESRRVVRFKTPKTDRARAVVLPSFAVDVLRRHRRVQLEERLKAGPAWVDHDLVCPSSNGAPWRPSNFSRKFTELVRKLGLRVTFHRLRHTHASHLVRAGVDVRTVAGRLGHATPSLTLNVYGHMLPGAQEEAARVTDRIIRGILSRARGGPDQG